MAARTVRHFTPEELFERSVATLVESWAYLASGSAGAEVRRPGGAGVAIFVTGLEREFLNNAVLPRRPADPGSTLTAIEGAYAGRGVERFAVWAHESEAEVAAELRRRGYAYDSSTRTMAMAIGELAAVDRSDLDVAEPGLEEFWRTDGFDGFVPGLAPERGHFYVARLGGENVAMLMAIDHDGDCGVYMVGTRPAARRRGLATALSAHAVAAARERGCLTASLQSTAMAEGVYARVGFRDLGRFDEYLPG